MLGLVLGLGLVFLGLVNIPAALVHLRLTVGQQPPQHIIGGLTKVVFRDICNSS